MSQIRVQKRFRILEVAVDWHGLTQPTTLSRPNNQCVKDYSPLDDGSRHSKFSNITNPGQIQRQISVFYCPRRHIMESNRVRRMRSGTAFQRITLRMSRISDKRDLRI